MYDPKHPGGDTAPLSLHGPNPALPALPLPPEFFVMRLVLQPTGLAVELSRPDMLVGRHSEADIRLALPEVSRRHCHFLFAEGCWTVVDLNSLNGTFVNGQRVQRFALRHGDRVHIGNADFEVDLQTGRKMGGTAYTELEVSLPPVVEAEQEKRRLAS